MLEFLPDKFIGDATITFYDPAAAKLASTWSDGKDVNGCKIKVQMAPVPVAPKVNIQTRSFQASRGKFAIFLGSSVANLIVVRLFIRMRNLESFPSLF